MVHLLHEADLVALENKTVNVNKMRVKLFIWDQRSVILFSHFHSQYLKTCIVVRFQFLYKVSFPFLANNLATLLLIIIAFLTKYN